MGNERMSNDWPASDRSCSTHEPTGVGWQLGCAYTSKLQSVFIVYMLTVYNKRLIILMYSSDCVILTSLFAYSLAVSYRSVCICFTHLTKLPWIETRRHLRSQSGWRLGSVSARACCSLQPVGLIASASFQHATGAVLPKRFCLHNVLRSAV